MEFFHGSLLLWITMGFISSFSLSNARGIIQFHRKQIVSDNISNKETSLVSQTHVYSPLDVEESKESGSPTSVRHVFDVTSFGAVGDGSTDDTEAFRKAWNAACEVDSGVLLAPVNHVFLITSIIFNGPCKPDLTFQVEGVLIPPDGPENWPKSERIWNWLVFYRVDRMKLRGNGTFEGKGEKWWELPCKPHRGPNGTTLLGPCDSPSLIHFFMSSNVVVEGLQMTNSPSFHIKFDNCNEVLVTNLNINSPALSPNTDGIHIEKTTSVSIYNSNIANGDDCISIGAGCSDVDIANITCTNSHGISIGSLGAQNTQACVSNITVRNVYLKNSDNGLRIKTWQGGTGSVTGITFENIIMDNVKNCIIVNQYYCLSNDCKNQTEALLVTDVSYKNIKGTYDVLTKPIDFACSDSVPCMGITLSEVELLPAVGEAVGDDPVCWNAYGTLETLTVPPIDCLQEGKPHSILERSRYNC